MGALGFCGAFTRAFVGALAGALVVVELVTLFVDIIDKMHNHQEDFELNWGGEHIG